MVAVKSGRLKARRQALLQAAAEVFFEQGYAATSIDPIIERAGGSKRNIYNEFGTSEKIARHTTRTLQYVHDTADANNCLSTAVSKMNSAKIWLQDDCKL